MKTSYIGADVDSKMTELAVDDGREVRRYRVPTSIPHLKEVLAEIVGHVEERQPVRRSLRVPLNGEPTTTAVQEKP